MKLPNVFLVISVVVLVSLREFSRAEKYELNKVKTISAIPAGGKMKYLEVHPRADTDLIPEEERTRICVEALERFREERPQWISELKADRRPEKMKPYLVEHSLFEGMMSHFAVLPAYECPTNPPIYIHLDIDEQKDETTFEVIFTKPYPRLTFKNFRTFHLLVAEDMYDADAEKIESMKAKHINPALYDFDLLDEEQRFQLCERATSILPAEERVELDKSQPTGKGNFKIVHHKSIDQEDTNDKILMRVFDCPSQPKIHVHVDGSKTDQRMWTVVRKADLSQPPALNVVQYDTILVSSIDTYENFQMEEEKELIRKHEAEKKKVMDLLETRDKNSVEVSREVQKLDFNALLKERKRIIEAAIDTDSELTHEERSALCAKAIRIVSGQEPKFASADKSTAKHYYSVLPKVSDGATVLVVNAYPCPTDVEVLLHVGPIQGNNRVVAIITRKNDFESLTSQV